MLTTVTTTYAYDGEAFVIQERALRARIRCYLKGSPTLFRDNTDMLLALDVTFSDALRILTDNRMWNRANNWLLSIRRRMTENARAFQLSSDLSLMMAYSAPAPETAPVATLIPDTTSETAPSEPSDTVE